MVKTAKAEVKVQTDRRVKSKERRETNDDRRQANATIAVERRLGERRAKVTRRRQIDPTTCERDYTTDEVEFMHALDQYKRSSGRMFPTCSEVLEVLRGIGYQKTPVSDSIASASHMPAANAAAIDDSDRSVSEVVEGD